MSAKCNDAKKPLIFTTSHIGQQCSLTSGIRAAAAAAHMCISATCRLLHGRVGVVVRQTPRRAKDGQKHKTACTVLPYQHMARSRAHDGVSPRREVEGHGGLGRWRNQQRSLDFAGFLQSRRLRRRHSLSFGSRRAFGRRCQSAVHPRCNQPGPCGERVGSSDPQMPAVAHPQAGRDTGGRI